MFLSHSDHLFKIVPKTTLPCRKVTRYSFYISENIPVKNNSSYSKKIYKYTRKILVRRQQCSALENVILRATKLCQR